MEKIIGKRILEVRKRISDLNQSDLGALFGVKNVAVSQWENGETMPSVEVLEKVADMAGESLDWLFGREDKTISNEERRLLRFFRGTSEEGQEIVLETVEEGVKGVVCHLRQKSKPPSRNGQSGSVRY
jgi:transcriptional regulator with XRE-family HTH domain